MIIIKVLIVVIIFKIITTTSSIITITLITDRYSKLIRSSYRYCFPHSLKKMLFNSVFVHVDVIYCF